MPRCKACGYECKWMETKRGKWILVEIDSIQDDEAKLFDKASGHIAHFANCPEADNFRSKNNERGSS